MSSSDKNLTIMLLASVLFLSFLILISRRKMAPTSLKRLRRAVYGLLPDEIE